MMRIPTDMAANALEMTVLKRLKAQYAKLEEEVNSEEGQRMSTAQLVDVSTKASETVKAFMEVLEQYEKVTKPKTAPSRSVMKLKASSDGGEKAMATKSKVAAKPSEAGAKEGRTAPSLPTKKVMMQPVSITLDEEKENAEPKRSCSMSEFLEREGVDIQEQPLRSEWEFNTPKARLRCQSKLYYTAQPRGRRDAAAMVSLPISNDGREPAVSVDLRELIAACGGQEPEERLPRLSHPPSFPLGRGRTMYAVMVFMRDFTCRMINLRPSDHEAKRHLIELVEPGIGAKLLQLELDRTSMRQLAMTIFEICFKSSWKEELKSELVRRVEQSRDEPFRTFAERLELYATTLEMDLNSEECLSYVRAKSRPEYQGVWRKLGANPAFFDFIEAAEAFEMDPLFTFAKSSCETKANQAKEQHSSQQQQTNNQRSQAFQPNRSAPKGGQPQKGGGGGNDKCFNCGGRGHKSFNCASKKQNGGSGSANSTAAKPAIATAPAVKPAQPAIEGPVTQRSEAKPNCTYCKKGTHSTADCFKRKREGGAVSVIRRKEEEEEEDPDSMESALGELFNSTGLWYTGDYVSTMEEGSALTISCRGVEDQVTCPAIVQGRKRIIAVDTGASWTMASPEAFNSIDADVVDVGKLQFAGATGKGVITKGKKALFALDGGREATITVMLIETLQGDRILLSDKDGASLGIRLAGLPVVFPRDSVREPDAQWVGDSTTPKDEILPTSEERAAFERIISKAAEENKRIPAGSTCTLADSAFRIELNDNTPVFKRQYPYNVMYKPIVQKQVEEWEATQQIEPATPGCNWNAPLLPVPKKSGGVTVHGEARVTEDLRAHNEKTKPPVHSIPMLEEMLRKLTGATVFAELDLIHAFHQIELHEDSRDITTFTDADGKRWRWKVMIEGAKCAATHMQWVLERVFAEDLHQIAIYIDNIVIPGKSLEECAERTAAAIARMNKARLRVNFNKSRFGLKRIRFMGSLIDGSSRSIDPLKVSALRSMERPRSGPQMEAFMGFVNYLRDFIPFYACVVGPLEKLRKCKVIDEERWRGEPEDAFNRLKNIVSQAPILQAIDWNLEFTVATDASQEGVGAVLYQSENRGGCRYIAFAAKSLNSAQRSYPATKRELLALIFALKKWRYLLFGRHVTVETDSRALVYINNSNERMILDWLDFILDFDLTMKHKRGVDNILPHNLSHLYDGVTSPIQQCEGTIFFLSKAQVDGIGVEEVARRMDDFIVNVVGKRQPSLEERRDLIKRKHAEGHCGADMMFKQLFREGVFWAAMMADCKEATANCHECLRFNVGRIGFHPMRPLKASLPFDHVVMDLIGQLPTTEGGHNFILILVDVLTRFIILRPLQAKSAKEVAWTLTRIFADFGVPRILQSDRDTAFLNETMTKLRTMQGFEQQGIMKYFPRTNGLVERNVMEVKKILNKWARGVYGSWDLLVPAMQIALNDRFVNRSATRAFVAMFGRLVNGFEDFRGVQLSDNDEAFKELQKRNDAMMEVIFPAIEENIRLRGEAEAEEANKRLERGKRRSTFKLGDKVMKKVDIQSSKLQQRWEGPFVIVEVNKVTGGFRLENMVGKTLRGEFPPEKLKIVRSANEGDDEDRYVVKEIIDHRGSIGNFEYKVKWVGSKMHTWAHELDFDAYDLIRSYWASRRGGEVQPLEEEVEEMAEVQPQQEARAAQTRSGCTVRKPKVPD